METHGGEDDRIKAAVLVSEDTGAFTMHVVQHKGLGDGWIAKILKKRP